MSLSGDVISRVYFQWPSPRLVAFKLFQIFFTWFAYTYFMFVVWIRPTNLQPRVVREEEHLGTEAARKGKDIREDYGKAKGHPSEPKEQTT